MKRITALLFASLFFFMAMTSCNSSKKEMNNPFFSEWTTPYGVPPFDSIRVEHFQPAFERALSLHNAEIEAIVSNGEEPTFENVILAFDNAGRDLERVSLVFDMLSSAESNAELQSLQEELLPMRSAHEDEILMNDDLFQKVKTLYTQRQNLNLDALQLRLLEKTYKEFVRSGALLEKKEKARLKDINEELSLRSVKFNNNILAENNAFVMEIGEEDLVGIPLGVREQAFAMAEEMGKKGRWVFTLHKPSMIPFLTHSRNRALREKIYRAYLNRGNNDNEYDNKENVREMARLRCEKAHLLGFATYADYVIDNQMAEKPRKVYQLLNEIWTPALAKAKGELKQMEKLFRQDNPDSVKFESWDWWHYADKLREQDYSLDEEVLRSYFSLENVQAGIFFLANRLYGLTFRPVLIPVYHPEVSAYEVMDVDNSHLGILYFDFFPRPGKEQGAWCGNYVEQSYQEGKKISPVVSIVTNFTRPTSTSPALLTLDEVETLFHEFGHALHFLFHDVKYRGLSEVEGDFVEFPSQLMENWAFQPEVLKYYATHYRTREVMPHYLMEKMQKTELFNQGFMTTELLAASFTDLDIHSIKDYKEFDPMAFEKNALEERRGLIPQIEPRYRYPYFAHIFGGGYASGYYFYTWSEVLDKDAFEAFRETGDIFNRRVADRLRHRLLEKGGQKDGMSLYRDFRGANPDKKAMLKSKGMWSGKDDEQEPQKAPNPQMLDVKKAEKKAENMIEF